MTARDSVFPLPPSSDFLHHLEDCVSATESCAVTLHNGLVELEKGTRDLPRLTKIMRNKHHYLLLPLPTIQSHKDSLATALAPQIDTLISKAEGGIGASNGRIQRLEERLSIIQSARLPVEEPSRVIHPTTFASTNGSAGGSALGVENVEPGQRFLDDLEIRELSIAQRRKVVMLKGKRERLEKERAKLLRA